MWNIIPHSYSKHQYIYFGVHMYYIDIHIYSMVFEKGRLNAMHFPSIEA